MKDPMRKIGNGTSRVALGTVAGLLCLILAFLAVSALFGTADMNRNNPGQENIDFLRDPIALNALFLVLSVVLGVLFIWFIRRAGLLPKLTVSRLAWGLGAWVLVVGTLWVLMSMSAPTHDSLIVTRAGVAAADGNLSYLDSDYFIRFPFQLGYVLWTELWARLLGLIEGSYLILEVVNVLCLAAGEMALVRLTDRLFGRRTVTVATTLALGLFIQPMIFCSFLYGTMPGFCFAAWSCLFFVRFLQTDRWPYLLGCGLTLSLSVLLKLNNLILLVAMVIILVCRVLRGRWWQTLLAALALCALVLPLRHVGVWQYELRTGKDFGDGIPMLSWMAMGLNDAVTAPGWYSHEYTVGNFNAVKGDTDAASALAKDEIAERVRYFREHPGEAATFFSEKVRSQWNEPTYQSLWNNQVRGQYMEKFGFAAYACGEGETTVKRAMDVGIQFIFVGALAAAIALLTRQARPMPDRAPADCVLYLIPLLVLGGFLYHALFEAKSQYVITYMIFLIPYAAWGIAKASDLARTLWHRIRRKRS